MKIIIAPDSFKGNLTQKEVADAIEVGIKRVIQMVAASGLPLVPMGKRNPMLTTTYGTSELIRSALDMGCRKLIVGIGGNATVDGRAGMAQALGVRLLDKNRNEIPLRGDGLEHLDHIDVTSLDPRIGETSTIVACDVDNPLTGPRGGPEVFDHQKSATNSFILYDFLNIRLILVFICSLLEILSELLKDLIYIQKSNTKRSVTFILRSQFQHTV